VEGLDQEVVRPSPASRLHVRRGIVGGHDDHPDSGQAGIGTDPRADGVAVDAGHLDVKHHQVGLDVGGLRERVGAVPGGDDLEAFQPQVDLHEAEDVGVVVGHEHGSSQHPSLSWRSGGSLRANHPGAVPETSRYQPPGGPRILSQGRGAPRATIDPMAGRGVVDARWAGRPAVDRSMPPSSPSVRPVAGRVSGRGRARRRRPCRPRGMLHLPAGGKRLDQQQTAARGVPVELAQQRLDCLVLVLGEVLGGQPRPALCCRTHPRPGSDR
jgi:hypothetical protein